VLVEWLDSGCVGGLAIDEYCITYCVMPTVLYLLWLDLGRPPFLVIRLPWDDLQFTKPIRIWDGNSCRAHRCAGDCETLIVFWLAMLPADTQQRHRNGGRSRVWL
jgi:hypothetical protein